MEFAITLHPDLHLAAYGVAQRGACLAYFDFSSRWHVTERERTQMNLFEFNHDHFTAYIERRLADGHRAAGSFVHPASTRPAMNAALVDLCNAFDAVHHDPRRVSAYRAVAWRSTLDALIATQATFPSLTLLTGATPPSRYAF